MSELPINKNKYELFKGVALSDNYEIVGYDLVYLSEIEIISISKEDYKDAEKNLKALADFFGFNCVLKVTKEQYTDNTSTTGIMDTKGTMKASPNPFEISRNYVVKTASTIKSITKTNNVFTIKGLLGIIGKPNPNANTLKIIFKEKEKIYLECIDTARNIYYANLHIKNIEQKLSIFPMNIFANFTRARLVKNHVETLVKYENSLKELLDRYGKDFVTIYKICSKNVTIKHMGE